MGMWTYEREQWKNGVQTVCGVDEAGAGPLMGPVYAAAVILPGELDIPGLNDSKKLAEKNDIAYGYRLLEAAGKKRGFLISGGEVDTERMAKILLDEFRSAKLGRFTLEVPE